MEIRPHLSNSVTFWKKRKIVLSITLQFLFEFSSSEGEQMEEGSSSSDSEEVIIPKPPAAKGKKSPAGTTPKRNPVSTTVFVCVLLKK